MKISDIATAAQLPDEDYLPIWSALMETSRGRRFLSEFSRRTRSAETRSLLASIQKLENALIHERQKADEAAQAAASAATMAHPSPLQHSDAIADAVASLDYASRIQAGAINDLAAIAQEMNHALATLRQLTMRLHPRENEPARRACEALDTRINDLDEIVAVQQIGLEHATAAAACLRQEAGVQISRQPASAPNAPAPSRPAPEPAAAGAPAPKRDRTRDKAPGEARAHGPAVQHLIQEITARLLNPQQNAS